ncbi:MAG TPA: DUF4213 domain-containing proteins [Syntrophorhabdaceae bacterium]|nr:DUF4213 domain-containing proteins [Syntrophorhabdaceae bacterium]
MFLAETLGTVRELYGTRLEQIKIERLMLGLFFGGIKLSDGSGGISYMPVETIHGNPNHQNTYFGPGSFKSTPVSLVLDAHSSSPILRVVQLLLLNALSQSFLRQGRYRVVYDQDVLDVLDIGSAKKIAMVGAITPFLRVFRNRKDITLHVI